MRPRGLLLPLPLLLLLLLLPLSPACSCAVGPPSPSPAPASAHAAAAPRPPSLPLPAALPAFVCTRRVLDEKETTVYKRAMEVQYQLKMKASRELLSEVGKKYPTMLFRWGGGGG